ncbi:hypothetical protein GCM10009618_09930 [Nesterenkonia lacusekhoensis]
MTDSPVTLPAMQWTPRPTEDLVIGPARWTGTAMVTDVSQTGEERIITIGLIERMLLEAMDGERDVVALQEALAADDVEVPIQKLFQLLNKFAMYGIVERPFTTDQGLSHVDAGKKEAPSTLEDSAVARGSAGGLFTLWRHLGWLGHPAMFTVLMLLGVLGAMGLGLSVAAAWEELFTDPHWGLLAASAALAILWHTVVTLLHENAHAGTFHRHGGRRPFLGVTRFGIIPLPNSHLSGLSLLPRGKKAQIIAAGPAVSAALALVPVAVWQLSEPGSWLHQLAALSVCLETVVLALGLAFFPNTDGSRLLETWAGADQIQQVAFRTLSGKNPLPAALPTRTRVLVRVYPILLVLTLLAWVLAAVWATWLVLA